MARRMVILTEGHSDPLTAKTACSVMRYRGDEVVAVLDSTQVGNDCHSVLGVGKGIPFVGNLSEANDANELVLGIAPQGGRIPDAWRTTILEALASGMNVTSGLHQFLSDDEEFASAAQAAGRTLFDVRKNRFRNVANREGIRDECLRVHTVGNDCNVGKMVTSLELARELDGRDLSAKFVATGQTGIMIEGDGCPIDCVVSDFVNGAAEELVLKNQHHDVIVVEGQGSVVHPRYSAVTTGLLHGCMPQGLILCYEAGRENVNHMEQVPLPPLQQVKAVIESIAQVQFPSQFIAVSMNSRTLDAAAAEAERKRVGDLFGLPVVDVIRDGPAKLADAVVEFHAAGTWKE